jgi:hypothetical protein
VFGIAYMHGPWLCVMQCDLGMGKAQTSRPRDFLSRYEVAGVNDASRQFLVSYIVGC